MCKQPAILRSCGVGDRVAPPNIVKSTKMTEPDSIQASHLSLLLKAGEALSSEKDIDALMELFITTAMALTNADGGTLYRLVDGQQLEFSILHNRSLKVSTDSGSIQREEKASCGDRRG